MKLKGSKGDCEIIFNGKIELLKSMLGGRLVVIITDKNVYELYAKRFSGFSVIVLDSGEQNKNLASLNLIYSKLIDLSADRKSFLIGIGGGIVCDITGFAASTFMRGMHYGFVPTTLLAMADASIGGKNGVNFDGYKNMVGVFNQPDFVLHDQSCLETLPASELCNGYAEIIKHAIIEDVDYFEYLEQNYELLNELDAEAVSKVIRQSVEIKTAIVEEDETEFGKRRILNFGHTFAHAFEKVYQIPHGTAVSLGMVLAARMSKNYGWLNQESVDRIINLVQAFKLPDKMKYDSDKMISAMIKDKKSEGDKIKMILLEAIGQARIVDIEKSALKEVLNDLR